MRNRILAMCMASVLSVGVVGCGKKKEEAAAPPPAPTRTIVDAQETIAEAAKTAQDQADATMKAAAEQAAQAKAELDARKIAAEKAAAQAEVEAQAQRDAVQNQYTTLVDGIKTNIGKKLYDQALAQVQKGLGMEALTAEQRNSLQSLMETIKKAMSQNVTDAAKEQAGGLLNKLGK